MKDPLLPWSLLALVRMGSADIELPYNPTRILTTPNSSFAYILQQSQDSANQGSLTAVDLERTFATSDVSTKSLSTTLPFLRDDTLVPYTPIIDSAGNITVISGSCTDGATRTQIWRFAPDPKDASGNGEWSQHERTTGNVGTASLTGVNFLNNGVAFSANVGSHSAELGFYMFGGMCPFGNSTSETWQSAATYSNTMLALIPTADAILEISSVASRGPPIAEAGLSMTGLIPTYRVNSSGEAQTQQQDFLLLGGHTRDAFINTSQVALFSLPQNSWSFLPVQQPSAARTDLAARQSVTQVEPRSGHTAVLSADGTSIIVLGGWVGDITNPAQPQLAILHLGSEYGGNDAQAWTWSIPSQSGTGLATGTGIYGHGATLLPGGVMMIVGGYEISASSSRVKRQSRQNILLYNTTSNSWVNSYTNPSIAEATSEKSSSSGGGLLSTSSQQAGLGVGLGLGVLLLVALIIFYFWYTKRLKQTREERERALLVHSSDGSLANLDQPFLDRGGIDGRGGDIYAGPNHQQMSQPAGATGLFTNIPNAGRGFRRGIPSRPYSYHAAPRYDESRLNGGSGRIHPILERQDEDDLDRIPTPQNPFRDSIALQEPEQAYDNYSTAEAKLRELQRVLESGTRPTASSRDPFADPLPNPLGSHPTSPVASGNGTGTVRRVSTHDGREGSPSRRPLTAETDGSMNWQIIEHDDDCEPSGLGSGSPNGRVSPTKSDERTSSTLSEQSHRSVGSMNSITRTMSTRTGAVLAAAFARQEADDTAATTPAEMPRTGTMSTTTSASGRKSPYYFQRSHQGSRVDSKRQSRQMEPTHHAEKSTDSFMTASSSFAQLQNEGEALLGGRPMIDRDDPYQRAIAAHSSTMQQPRQLEPEHHNPPPQRMPGWVGSLRRALTAMSNDRSFSLTSQIKHPISPTEPEARTSSASPSRARKVAPSSSAPRRAISDGGALLRQKRGQQDWQDANAAAGDWGEPRSSLEARQAEGEWDVEGAASKRDFQVMFSVPKARLRVVNADVDRASMRSASDGAVSRKGSMVNLKREGSVNTVRSRSDGEKGHKERQRLLGWEEEEEEEGEGGSGRGVSSGVRI